MKAYFSRIGYNQDMSVSLKKSDNSNESNNRLRFVETEHIAAWRYLPTLSKSNSTKFSETNSRHFIFREYLKLKNVDCFLGESTTHRKKYLS